MTSMVDLLCVIANDVEEPSPIVAVTFSIMPRFALASPAVEAPVPPWATAMSVAAQVPEAIVPTEVRDEVVTPEPSVVALRTDELLILNSLPEAALMCSEKSHESESFSQRMVLSVAPFKVIPPPSAVASDGTATVPSSMFLSSTVSVVAVSYTHLRAHET